MLRRRKTNVISEESKIIQFDAFPKVLEQYQKKTTTGGTISLFCIVIIVFLVYSEINDFLNYGVRFHFTPDEELDTHMDLNVDITIAMPCRFIGADVLDSTGQNVLSFGKLKEEDTWFELSPRQREHFVIYQYLNGLLREKAHGMQQLLWKAGYTMFGDLPAREVIPDRPPDACRLHGNLQLTKVAGNFHVTAGKVLSLPMLGHAHLSIGLADSGYNYSHRIHQFSFGTRVAGLVQPLEGDELITTHGKTMFQYFIVGVPSEVVSLASASSGVQDSLKTWQYSVRNQTRIIDHHFGSHGIPGIYFKYDVAPLRVRIVPDAPPLWRFILRLCAIVGGVYTSAGIINNWIRGTLWLFCWAGLRSPSDVNHYVHTM